MVRETEFCQADVLASRKQLRKEKKKEHNKHILK